MRKHTKFESENSGRLLVPSSLPFDFHVRRPLSGAPRELILLLHGFAESGKRILDKLEPLLPADAVVLAPNGPFPLPHKTDTGYVMTHSWYLYDPMAREYFIDMRLALEFLTAGIAQLKYEGLPKRIVGFSQGGYLAPFVAQTLSDVRQVVGIACEFLDEELTGALPARMDAVHGTADDVVAVADAKKSHAALVGRGVTGRFIEVEGAGHRIDGRMRNEVKELLLR
ncbi:MAG: hypothetical protein HY074_20250 [Deltaproteobacteria bacterium]|nr:hypothetical protein [Deltaproteobacteria bacterium]